MAQENHVVHIANGNPAFSVPQKQTSILERPFHSEEFDEVYQRQRKNSSTIKETFKKTLSKCSCSAGLVKSLILKIFPFIGIMKGYKLKDDLPNDIISGLTVGIMNIPQGMAYALLADLPPIYGLYVSLWPVLIYFFFGTSRHVSIGTFAVISIMVGSCVNRNLNSYCSKYISSSPTTTIGMTEYTATVTPVATMMTENLSFFNGTTVSPQGETGTNDLDKCKVRIAAAVTFIAGLIQLGMGIFNLGFLTIYLSTPLTRGFTTGCSMHVFTSQIKYVFGINPQRYSGVLKLVYIYIDMFRKIREIPLAPVIISVLSIIVLIVTKEFINPRVKAKIKMPVPIELILVIAGTIASHFGKFNQRWDVKIVGYIPRGIPAPEVPPSDLYSTVIADALVIAVVSYAISVSMVNMFAEKHNYSVNSTSELIAYGVANAGSSFLNCFMSSVSLSRSLVQDTTGGRTQVAGLVSCVLVLVVVLAVGPLFEQLPNAILASIILVALKGMFLQFLDLKKFWKTNKYDFACWLVAFLATTFLNVDIGLIVGVGFSFLTVIFRTQRPPTCVLGRLPHTDIYKDIKEYSKAQEIQGVKIYRFESALFYASKDRFLDELFRKSGTNPKNLRLEQVKVENKLKKLAVEANAEEKVSTKETNLVIPKSDLHHLVIDCCTIGFIDTVGMQGLLRAIDQYETVGVTVLLANCTGEVYNMLKLGGYFEKCKRDSIYVTIHDAVLAALENDPVMLSKLRNDVTICYTTDAFTAENRDLLSTTEPEISKL